jgi:hypothetical protein
VFRVETIPLVLGVIVALIGLAILADAWLPENNSQHSERRRQARVERSLGGEAAIGISVLCMAAALIGRDTWRYSTVAVIAGAVLFFFGVLANRRYLRERLVNRGALRRGAPGGTGPKRPPPKGPLMPR